jgi:hypothetical protein
MFLLLSERCNERSRPSIRCSSAALLAKPTFKAAEFISNLVGRATRSGDVRSDETVGRKGRQGRAVLGFLPLQRLTAFGSTQNGIHLHFPLSTYTSIVGQNGPCGIVKQSKSAIGEALTLWIVRNHSVFPYIPKCISDTVSVRAYIRIVGMAETFDMLTVEF